MFVILIGLSMAILVDVARCISMPSMIVNLAVRVANAITLKYFKDRKMSLVLELNAHERCNSLIEAPLKVVRHLCEDCI